MFEQPNRVAQRISIGFEHGRRRVNRLRISIDYETSYNKKSAKQQQ